jgi:hypothetical protein
VEIKLGGQTIKNLTGDLVAVGESAVQFIPGSYTKVSYEI